MNVTIGMIVPPAGDMPPPEAMGLYPDSARFAARSLALQELTIAGYDAVIDRVAELCRRLRHEDGADAIMLMGTSLSFFRGAGFNDELVRIMHEASGVPCSTMSNAIRDALRVVGARRIAVGTAYSSTVNNRLRDFLLHEGFEVTGVTGLDLVGVDEIRAVPPEAVANLALEANRSAGGQADAVLVSCGGLPALDLAAMTETVLAKPVIASSTAGVWAAMRLAGLDATCPALGMLSERSTRKCPVEVE